MFFEPIQRAIPEGALFCHPLLHFVQRLSSQPAVMDSAAPPPLN
jgi:hypothetical protein